MGNKLRRVIISGGGTGGHIFPAISIAHALKKLVPGIDILFVGAKGKMEMDKVPAAGYRIIGLNIQGINRSSIIKNLLLPFKLFQSVRAARRILKEFKPDVVVGVGGYASGPVLHAAGKLGIPYLIQEQNSFAGITNKKLGAKADKVCVAFDGMERFFPKEKLLVSGNPIRHDAVDIAGKEFEAKELFGLDKSKKTILVTGGSLGARTLNNSMLSGLKHLKDAGIQLIWQCGNYYYEELKALIEKEDNYHVWLKPFLHRMDFAYAAADLIIARAGAGTIAELCAVGKPVILVPSPNVAEDHQTKNALALVEKDAAQLVIDGEAVEHLINDIVLLLQDKTKCKRLSENIKKLAKLDADEVIANEVLKLAGKT
ncbi:undecaprenyldiphospho-muramoylpentapeptide beta-N-acetylglucosaminyltransferase [Olivibacter sp. SDN3]|uniref:undecaprenyldiphospho-muramoylpentapeptide beta-N-acetylglucosaminyltransferase n=1 Tax=Olivibacter sp. SDN3 TaxID=2764720 RepID=UPI001650FB5F|nr:undecaprenyldiphospho-muramoylpentapeptide beta-N-acetylglucosaminyltransferase [Olivibacter sp. SDN3]QNL50118.1 undecaprenyldiphospho-muramoylpentapeptide beta-N-acetylglucosaminyltransferase [Olivibacter sp. SDN3]